MMSKCEHVYINQDIPQSTNSGRTQLEETPYFHESCITGNDHEAIEMSADMENILLDEDDSMQSSLIDIENPVISEWSISFDSASSPPTSMSLSSAVNLSHRRKRNSNKGTMRRSRARTLDTIKEDIIYSAKSSIEFGDKVSTEISIKATILSDSRCWKNRKQDIILRLELPDCDKVGSLCDDRSSRLRWRRLSQDIQSSARQYIDIDTIVSLDVKDSSFKTKLRPDSGSDTVESSHNDVFAAQIEYLDLQDMTVHTIWFCLSSKIARDSVMYVLQRLIDLPSADAPAAVIQAVKHVIRKVESSSSSEEEYEDINK